MDGKTRLLASFTALLMSALICALPSKAEVTRDDDSEIAQTCGVPAYLWSDETVAHKAVVIAVHGFTQQGKCVEALATKLAEDGYIVISPDQRGHGRWQSQHRQDGMMVDYKATIEDVRNLIKASKDAHPELPLYCIGESAGAGIVSDAAGRTNSNIDGLVLSSAGSRPRVYNIAWIVKDFICNIYRLNHPIDVRRYIKNYASNDPRVTEEMITDPLDRSALTGREILRTVGFIRHTKSAVKHFNDDIPLLVIQGSEDHIVAPSTVRSIVRHAKSSDKNLVVFPEYGHVLVGTSYIRPRVRQTIEDWLDAQYQMHTRSTVSARLTNPVKPAN